MNATEENTDWMPGEPNDDLNGEDCAHIWISEDYSIRDADCGSHFYPLCVGNEHNRFD